MKTAKDLQGRMDAVIKELNELRELETLTDEQDQRADQLVKEVNDIAPKLREALVAEANIAEHTQRGESRGTVAGLVSNGTDTTKVDTRSIGQQLTDSDEFKTLLARNGEGIASLQLKSFFQPEEQRALVATGTLPAAYLEPMRIPGISRLADPYGSLRDVLNVGQTNADSLVYFQEDVFTNNAATVGEATETTGTSGLKPESAITFAQKTSNVVTIAHWIPITRQTLWNAPELQSYIEGRLIDGLKMAEDDQLLTGDGTGTNMVGLLNTTGIQVLDAAAFTATAVNDAGTDNENFNRILRARTLIGTVGRAQANFVVLNPLDHEAFMTSTDAQKQYFGAGPFAAGNVPTLWGMRVVINENLAAGTALVGDGRQATIWDRMSAQVLVGTINDQFVRNMLTLLAEERVGLTVFRPKAFAKVTLAAA